MVRTPDQGLHFSHTREMRGIQTADGAATDNANPFHLYDDEAKNPHGRRENTSYDARAPASLISQPGKFPFPPRPETNYLHY